MAHSYEGSISVKFYNLPSLRPELLKTQFASLFERFKGASTRRHFYLEQDWSVEVSKVQYDPNLNGTIIVPRTFQNVQTRIDGASVPLPWFVSFLTFGILRPIGILLTASIVHDFAYEHGSLLYREAGGALNPRPVARDAADRLFRDMISTVNRMPVAAFIAWVVVRLGWFLVKYDGQLRTGAFPLFPLVIAIAFVLFIAALIQFFGLFNFIVITALFYLIAYAGIAIYH